MDEICYFRTVILELSWKTRTEMKSYKKMTQLTIQSPALGEAYSNYFPHGFPASLSFVPLIIFPLL